MSALHYAVEAADLNAHLFRVTLTIAQPTTVQTVSLPVWIPGSYLVREFSKNLQNLSAKQGRRQAALVQLDKCTWQITCRAGEPLVLRYEVYAFDNSVRTAWLDSQRGFFNGTSVCLRVHGQEQQPHHLQLQAVKNQPKWQAATGLTPVKVDKRGFGLYTAADSTLAAYRTALWWQVPCPRSMVTACWPTRKKSAKPKSAFGMAKANRPDKKPHSRIICSCSTPCTTATAVWSTATAPR
jgi:predicted metalloprotease with PDZ domain